MDIKEGKAGGLSSKFETTKLLFSREVQNSQQEVCFASIIKGFSLLHTTPVKSPFVRYISPPQISTIELDRCVTNASNLHCVF